MFLFDVDQRTSSHWKFLSARTKAPLHLSYPEEACQHTERQEMYVALQGEDVQIIGIQAIGIKLKGIHFLHGFPVDEL